MTSGGAAVLSVAATKSGLPRLLLWMCPAALLVTILSVLALPFLDFIPGRVVLDGL